MNTCRVYHACTLKQYGRYRRLRGIRSPVRFWLTRKKAVGMMGRCPRRTILLSFERPDIWYPLPTSGAGWSPHCVRRWRVENAMEVGRQLLNEHTGTEARNEQAQKPQA